MATNTITGTLPNPFSLGKIFPGASFATLSAPLTQNIVPVMPDAVTIDPYFNELIITAWGGSGAVAGNDGNIYVCSDAKQPDLVNFLNVLAILGPGQVWPRTGEYWANNKDIHRYFIGAGNATDFATVTAGRF